MSSPCSYRKERDKAKPLSLCAPLCHSPVNGNGQEGISGDVEGDSTQVVDRGTQDMAVLPGELPYHIVVHLKGAAHNGHQEVRDGQVGNKQVGEIAKLFVAGQGNDEDEVADATHQHDTHQSHANDDLGGKESLRIGHILLFIQGCVIVAIAESERQGSSLGSVGIECRKEAGGSVRGILTHSPHGGLHPGRCCHEHQGALYRSGSSKALNASWVSQIFLTSM